VHVNKGFAKYRADGSILIILAHEDPRVPYANWLTTAGHTQGTMSFRWVKPQVPDAVLPHPDTQVVDVSRLSTMFPDVDEQ